jgi:hypothetical protein
VGLVPADFWAGLFPGGDSLLGAAINAVFGVTADVVSFIGSIGNVPFAAALWTSGASFGGVVALTYADLITIPVMILWRQFFGWKAAAYIFLGVLRDDGRQCRGHRAGVLRRRLDIRAAGSRRDLRLRSRSRPHVSHDGGDAAGRRRAVVGQAPAADASRAAALVSDGGG